MKPPTHAELVVRAGRWLRHSCRVLASYEVGGKPYWIKLRCAVVFAELVTSASETPDAIGFANHGHTSILIECKTSRADFRKDTNKWHRQREGYGMGSYRFVMAPSGLLLPDEMPAGWGLLSVDGRRVTIERDAIERRRYRMHETQMLWSYCRRMQATEQKDMTKV